VKPLRPAILNSPVILDIPAEPQAMYIVRGIVEKIATALGFQPAETDKLVLAADEACTNVIRHAYKQSGKNERIVITFNFSPESFEIWIRDFGEGGDPEDFRGRDLKEVRPGGLGIHFIKSAVDRVEYDSPSGGGMLLKLIKFMPTQEKTSN
jgi:anti-sigma regulatory factor (Ser/Thr protein kinase)